ncbi:unannotated protein [freshwater metagenome]
MRWDYVIADTSVVRDMPLLQDQVAKMGGTLVVEDVRMAPGSVHHDPRKLTSVFAHIMSNSLVG